MPYYTLAGLDSFGPGLVVFEITITSAIDCRARVGISLTVERSIPSIIHKCVQMIIEDFTNLNVCEQLDVGRGVYPRKAWPSVRCSTEMGFEAAE